MKKSLRNLLTWIKNSRYLILIDYNSKDKIYTLTYSTSFGLFYQTVREYTHIHGKKHQYWSNKEFSEKWIAEDFRDTVSTITDIRKFNRIHNRNAKYRNQTQDTQ